MAHLAAIHTWGKFFPLDLKRLYVNNKTESKVKNDHRSKFSNLSNWKDA